MWNCLNCRFCLCSAALCPTCYIWPESCVQVWSIRRRCSSRWSTQLTSSWLNRVSSIWENFLVVTDLSTKLSKTTFRHIGVLIALLFHDWTLLELLVINLLRNSSSYHLSFSLVLIFYRIQVQNCVFVLLCDKLGIVFFICEQDMNAGGLCFDRLGATLCWRWVLLSFWGLWFSKSFGDI